MFSEPPDSRGDTLARLPSAVFGLAFLLGALFTTVMAIFFFAGLGSDHGFAAMLRLTTMFFPFVYIRPVIQPSVAWPLTIGYWVLLASLIGKVGRPRNWPRMAVVTLLAIVNCGVAAELLLRFAGYKRFLFIEL